MFQHSLLKILREGYREWDVEVGVAWPEKGSVALPRLRPLIKLRSPLLEVAFSKLERDVTIDASTCRSHAPGYVRLLLGCWNECNFVANESFLIKYVPSKFYTSTENDPPIDIPIIRYFLKDKKKRKILPGSRRVKNKKKYILSREMEKFEVDRLERVDETV